MIPETLSCLPPQSLENFSKQKPMTVIDVLGEEDLPKKYEELMRNLKETVMPYIGWAMEDANCCGETLVRVDVAPNTGTYSCSKGRPIGGVEVPR